MRFTGRRLTLTGALACGLAGLSVATLLAQQNAPFRSVTNTISLFATVTDAQNRLVPDLVQGDFEIFDNDKAQALLVFNQETLPIRVVMMLDTSASMTATIALLKKPATVSAEALPDTHDLTLTTDRGGDVVARTAIAHCRDQDRPATAPRLMRSMKALRCSTRWRAQSHRLPTGRPSGHMARRVTVVRAPK